MWAECFITGSLFTARENGWHGLLTSPADVGRDGPFRGPANRSVNPIALRGRSVTRKRRNSRQSGWDGPRPCELPEGDFRTTLIPGLPCLTWLLPTGISTNI